MARIALDAMGGDAAPQAPVQGALDALPELPDETEIMLVGRTAEIEATLAERAQEQVPDRVQIVEAPEVIGSDEQPLQAVRAKRKSSIVVGLGLQKEGRADAFVSAGNTGAVLAASTILLGLHSGVPRAAIGTVFPTAGKPVLVMDAGASIDCSPRELRGFAHLGAIYARDVLGRPDPAVGLLNIGEEPTKGTDVVKEAHRLLSDETHAFRFVGNVEGQDIVGGDLDVVVCDGFVGNVVLKFYESVGRLITKLLRRALDDTALASEGMHDIFEMLDWSNYGGAPLLGVRGVSIICHGRSPANAFKNAILVAQRASESRMTQHTEADMAGPEAVA